MRLGLDLLFLIPDETGGRETYARELISAMFEIEPGLTATAFVNSNATPPLVRDLHSLMRVVRIPVSARHPEPWALGELALLPIAGARARVQVMHSMANFAPVAARFHRVITIHDLQYRAVPELLTRARRFGTAMLLETAVGRADRIITVSQFSRDEVVRELGVSGERIDVIPNGVGARAARSRFGERDLRERLRLDDRPVALTVAGDLPHKNLGALVEGFALIPSQRRPVLVITGLGTDGSALRAQVEDAGLQDDVRLLGFRPAEELEGLYALATCAVLPSLYEGFGLPVLEAMTRGVPVACSDIPALREVAGGAALYFAPREAAEIASTIDRLVDDGELRRRFAAAGRQRAALFSWARAAKSTLSCYRRALDPAGAGRR